MRQFPGYRRIRGAAAACLIGVLVVGGLSLLPAAAQTPSAPALAPAPAPIVVPGKTCLVLSGGGARGLAHIGALQALQQLRVPIDCIAGTSMGAIIGGLYAEGVSVDVLRSQVSGMDWASVLSSRPAREGLAFRRKRADEQMPGGIEFGLSDHGQVQFPNAAVNTTQLEQVLTNLTLPALTVRDFNDLPIPFRAVATNMVTGKKVILQQGVLATALRASMSVPGVFPPTEFGGALLGDGGLVDNLPVDVARDMGAQHVVAINIGTPLASRESLDNIVGLTSQMINILIEQNIRAQIATLKPGDVLISPDLGDLSSLDFQAGDRAIKIGYDAVMAARAQLEPLALPPAQYAQWRDAFARRAQSLVAQLQFNAPLAGVEVRGLSAGIDQTLKARLEQKPGEPLQFDKVRTDVDRLFGSGDFSRVDYRLVSGRRGQVLEYRLQDKPWGPNYLRFGLGLYTDLRNQSRFSLQLSQRRPWLNSLGGEWRNDLQIGWRNRWMSELYQPITRGGWLFVSPYLDLDARPVDVYSGNNPVLRYRLTTQRVGLDLGVPLGDYGELRAGLSRANIYGTYLLGAPPLNNSSALLREGGMRLLVLADRLDHAYFPRKGWSGRGELFFARTALGSDANYDRIDLSGQDVASFGRHTVEVAARVASFRDRAGLLNLDYLSLGGFDALGGYREGQLIGNYLIYGRIGYRYELVTPGLFGGAAYLGLAYERGNTWAQRAQVSLSDLRSSTSVYLGTDTPLGPVYFGLGKAPGQKVNFYLTLGRP
ncbi:MAG: patatin-like phospholipase family protein [Thiomonas arsenitoxydans]|uniref:Patatin-like phospholipase family protein n=1 Tax=Thiomonas arsenitoxydans (strain DSM 22701 / CIP 110005 / 3As) TaxID=426114 RepID=A0A8I1MVV7_THIA3|nr:MULTISPECIES: patatin-like phospholipase family protein [Thiomonas]MBN8743263.1 patatin-like phospholipase family protein [Thiomonas arsenitoxydans]ODU98854.1 MAG: patatin [Thiomonas sp. SCN 64-16]